MRLGRRVRWVALGVVVLALAGFAGYVAYAAAEGGEWVIHPDDIAADCRTPAVQFGWAYEAVGYDIAADANLRPEQRTSGGKTTWWCPAQSLATRDDILTSDGIRLAGWHIPAAGGAGPDGPTVLLVHGRSSNKSDFLRYAPPLHEAYNLLVIDLRNGGGSGGTTTTMGVGEGRDVAAAVAWLTRAKRPAWTAAVGVSLGGAAILQALPQAPAIRAVVLDSVHGRIVDAMGTGVAHDRGYPAWPTGWAMATGASLRLGFDITAADPVRTIPALGDRPLLLLHGARDPYDVPDQSAEVNRRAAEAAGVPVELHYCAGAGHAEVRDRCPDEWAAWVRGFLARAGG